MRSGSCCSGPSRGLTQGSVIMPGQGKAWWGFESPRLHPGPGPASSTFKLTLCLSDFLERVFARPSGKSPAGRERGTGGEHWPPDVEGEFPFVRLGKQQV